MSAKALKAVEGYNVFPSEQTQIADGKYKIAYENKPVRDVEADGPSIKAEIWFKSPVSFYQFADDLRLHHTTRP